MAGATGTNLESALIHLHANQPMLFPSERRYDYRITNAITRPIARALGDAGSEAPDAEIRTPSNIQRVRGELEGCAFVVLSGKKAGLLAEAIRIPGRDILKVTHVGNSGLNSKHRGVPEHLRGASSRARREYRVRLWADAVLLAIARGDAT